MSGKKCLQCGLEKEPRLKPSFKLSCGTCGKGYYYFPKFDHYENMGKCDDCCGNLRTEDKELNNIYLCLVCKTKISSKPNRCQKCLETGNLCKECDKMFADAFRVVFNEMFNKNRDPQKKFLFPPERMI